MVGVRTCGIVTLFVCLYGFDAAFAQSVTANGTSGPITISRDDTVTIHVVRGGGSATTTDWVGIYAVDSANNAYLNWYYLNGEKTAPATGDVSESSAA
jgi:hypothetical protein